MPDEPATHDKRRAQGAVAQSAPPKWQSRCRAEDSRGLRLLQMRTTLLAELNYGTTVSFTRCIEYGVTMDFVHPVAAVIPGAQGRVLATLSETTAHLNLRTLARLSGVSIAQASRVLPGLVELGLVERHEVPPSSQFRLVRTHVAARAVLELAAAPATVLLAIGRAAAALEIRPDSVIVFGSFARGEAGRESDLDAVFVRPDVIDEDDAGWAASVEQWRSTVRTLTGNPVEVLEVSTSEARSRLDGNRRVWQDIRRDGRVVHGLTLEQLVTARE